MTVHQIGALFVCHNGAKMSRLGSKDAKQRYEIPSDMSVHDFVRRAVAEAKLIIAEFEKTQAEMDAPDWRNPTPDFDQTALCTLGISG